MRQASKSRSRPAKRQGKARIGNVTPVVVRRSKKSSKATIPVSIRRTGKLADAKAVIPVEVKNARGKSVTRAAVVPVRVRTRSKSQKSTRRPHLQVRHKPRSSPSLVERARRLELSRQAPERQNNDLLTKSVVVLTAAEETVVNVAGSMAKSGLHLVSKLLNASFRSPFVIAGNSADKAQELYRDAKDFAEDMVA